MTETTPEQSQEEIVVDLNENKTEPPPPVENTNPVPAKNISDLTDAEKKILIDNAKAGIENPFYNVKIYKNGNTRICKKKTTSISNNAVTNQGERVIKSREADQKVYLTDNQLIWEHLLELETKYSNLYRKHKKLKAKYNDLYVEDDQILEQVRDQPQVEPKPDQKENVTEHNRAPTPLPNRNWRTFINNKNFYLR